jgi:hypothetical protein
MYDADAIEAINFEQLATITDRLLLRGRAADHWPRIPSLVMSPARAASATQAVMARSARAARTMQAVVAPSARAASAPRPVARGSQPRIAWEPHPPVIPASAPPELDERTIVDRTPPQLEHTMVVRASSSPSSRRAQVVVMTVVIPALFGIVAGLAALLVL